MCNPCFAVLWALQKVLVRSDDHRLNRCLLATNQYYDATIANLG